MSSLCQFVWKFLFSTAAVQSPKLPKRTYSSFGSRLFELLNNKHMYKQAWIWLAALENYIRFGLCLYISRFDRQQFML